MNVDRQVELKRIAKLFGKSPAELGYLGALDGRSLQALRKQYQNAIIAEYEPFLGKFGVTPSLTPTKISVMVCIQVLGPLLTSYLSYYTPVKQAAKLAKAFPADFMAAVAEEIIPEKAEPMLRDMPIDTMRETTRLLAANRQWYVMGGYVDFMPEEKNLALLDEISTAEGALRISTFAQNKPRIAALVAQFSDEQVRELVIAAIGDDELMREICLIGELLSAEQKMRIKSMSGKLPAVDEQRLRAYAEANGFMALL